MHSSRRLPPMIPGAAVRTSPGRGASSAGSRPLTSKPGSRAPSGSSMRLDQPPDTHAQTQRQREDPPPPVGAGHPDWTVLICPDKFKGTLTAEEAALAMERGVKAVWPHCTTRLVPLADGG